MMTLWGLFFAVIAALILLMGVKSGKKAGVKEGYDEGFADAKKLYYIRVSMEPSSEDTGTSKSAVYPCKTCHRAFKKPDYLARHIKRMHLDLNKASSPRK